MHVFCILLEFEFGGEKKVHLIVNNYSDFYFSFAKISRPVCFSETNMFEVKYYLLTYIFCTINKHSMS